MMRSIFFGAILALTLLTAFAYDDCEGCIELPYDDSYYEYEPRKEVDPYDYIEQPKAEMSERFESNEDFMLHYCMMEGFRAAIC